MRQGIGEQDARDTARLYRDERRRLIGMDDTSTEDRIRSMARFPEENINPVLRVKADGTITYANAAARSVLAAWGTNVGGDVPNEWSKAVSRTLATGRHELRELDLPQRSLSIAVVPVSDAGYVNLYASDITARRRAEAALLDAHSQLESRIQDRTAELTAAYRKIQQNERRYRLLAENVTDMIWTTDLDLNFTYVSPSCRALTGHSPERVIEEGLRGLLAPASYEKAQDVFGRRLAHARREGGGSTRYPWSVDLELARADGDTTWTETTVAFLRDTDGQLSGLLGVTRDIGERKRLEQQLLQAQKMEAVGRLAGGVAHDFNNMMQVVTGYSTRVLRTTPEDDPRREHIEEILKAGKRAAGLTQQLLAFSRKQVLKPELLNLNSIVAGMQTMLQSVVGEDVRLTTRLAEDLWQVEVDPARMEQVLMNLSVNARDAMHSGGTLSIETSNVRLEQGHGHDPDVPAGLYVMLVVRDVGCGMDENTRARLFEPFFTTKAPGEGTGLGLSTVYGTIEQSGGALSVRSVLDEGTTFSIYLPRSTREKDASPGGQPRLVLSEAAETILVVEDEESVRQLTVIELDEMGYRVLQAGSKDEAIAASRGHAGKIDLMLTDVVLAKASGPDVYELLAGERPDMRVLYMSGHAERRIVNHGVLASGVQFIEKPFTSEQLGVKVREALGTAARHD